MIENTKKKFIYIVIPVFNRLQYTIGCIKSLEKQSFREFKILVIDDGSTDGTSDYIKENFPEVVLVEGDGNLWWTGATNKGVRKVLEMADSESGYVLTLNNDLVVESDYLIELVKLSSENGIVGSVSVDFSDESEIAFAGLLWNSSMAKYRAVANLWVTYEDLLERVTKKYIESDLLTGRGTLIPLSAFENVGLFDECNFPHYAADLDFSWRCKKKGYKIIVAKNAVVKSHVEATGIARNRRNLTFRVFLHSLTSIKSPNNLQCRWRWAKKHTRIPILYFLIDTARICGSFLRIRVSYIFRIFSAHR